MPYILPVMPKPENNFSAVKIQINNPKAISSCCPNCSDCSDTGNKEAVDIQVNRPEILPPKHQIYNYPRANEVVTYDMTGYSPVSIPPVSYSTNLINNRTFVNADFDMNLKAPKKHRQNNDSEVKVPEPEFTTTEKEKTEPAFHGLNFKGNSPKVEIVPPVEIKPDVDINLTIDNLSSEDYDVQAKQIADIVASMNENPEKLKNYIVSDVFSSLIKIVNTKTENLVPPSDKQEDTRKKIIINELFKRQAEAENKKVTEDELPYKLTHEEIVEAINLSPMEQAERNKEYALVALAVLAKKFGEEVEKQNGNVVPLTDLPGASAMVETIKNEKNSSVCATAIDALRYIKRPEYKDELKSIFTLASKLENPFVAQYALSAMESLDK